MFNNTLQKEQNQPIVNSLKLKLKPGHSIHDKGSQSEPEETNIVKKKKKTWQRSQIHRILVPRVNYILVYSKLLLEMRVLTHRPLHNLP